MVSWTRLVAAALWALYLYALATHPDGAAVATSAIRNGGLAAAGVLVLVAIVAASRGVERARPPWPSGWSFAIAAVPILLLLRSPPVALDHRAALGRSAAATQPAPPQPPATTAPATAAPGGEDGTTRLDRLAGVQGKVRVIAMVVQPAGRLSYLLPASRERVPEPLVLLRFRMICCAADSMPVAVQMTGIPLAEVEDGMWVEIEGTVRMFGGEPLVEATSWKLVETPAEPYLTGTSWLGR